MATLVEKIKRREAEVAVIGIGYVGLPLATEMARAGFRTVGYDKSEDKVRAVRAGRSYIGDVSDEVLGPMVTEGRLSASTDPSVLQTADVVIICVPTPLNKTKEPDNSFIIAAADDLKKHLHREQLVILESTTFPGFTREVLLPKLQETGLKVGTDFYLCFSPERVDPGNAKYHTRNTPKVVGGTTSRCLEAIQAMYGEVLERLVPVSSTDAAEMVKLLENTFRAVNIGLVNEVAIMSQKLGLDTWEIIEAAATKPFGFMPFYPGPGLGGHCIPVDPLYLSWKLKTLKYEARFIELADDINTHMPHVVLDRVRDALNDRKKALNGARVLVLGVAYKKDIDDMRESPAVDVIQLLQAKGAEVSYHDPYVPTLRLGDHGAGERLTSRPLEELASYDCVAILTDHSNVDYGAVVRDARLVVDTRNATRKVRAAAKDKVVIVKRAAAALALVLGLVAVPSVHARSQADIMWPPGDVFGVAVRFIRVDRSCKVSDKDPDAGYITFDCLDDAGKPSRKGALELIPTESQGRRVTRAQVTLSDEPRYVELRFLELLERKVRDERGPALPPLRAPTPPPPPDAGH